jgi:hypothetical protein
LLGAKLKTGLNHLIGVEVVRELQDLADVLQGEHAGQLVLAQLQNRKNQKPVMEMIIFNRVC